MPACKESEKRSSIGLPPPYSLEDTRAEQTSIRKRYTIKSQINDDTNDSLPRYTTEKYLHVTTAWRSYYYGVHISEADFSKEDGHYDEISPDREQIQFTFFKYPPRCKSHCCTENLLQVWRPYFWFVDMWFRDHITRAPEWVFDCSNYPEPPKQRESEYWDVEVQGDIRFSKSFENLLSRYFGWRLATVQHIPYIVDSGPRRLTLIGASIFIYLICNYSF